MVLKLLDIKAGNARIMSFPCDYSPPTTTVCRWQVSLASPELAFGHPIAGRLRVTAVLAEQSSSVAALGIWICETVTKLPCEVLKKR